MRKENEMNLSEFERLIKKAEIDENGNLFYRDKYKRKIYFATVKTVCDDFVDTYCYETKGHYECYDRHFTRNDDSLEIQIVRKDKK